MIINKEKDIQYVLANLDITYIRELSIKKLHKYYHTTVDGHLKAKRFDYYLPKLRTVIEFDGDQHFTPIDYFGGMDQFMSTVTTDFEKMNYCFDNNIKVIRLTQGTNSDVLAQAINDYKHNLITIKDNQLENQSIVRFELPESFNVHIENQTLKSKMDHLTSHYESEITKLNETITELQDELESLKKPQTNNSMILAITYAKENYPELFTAKIIPKSLMKAIYDDAQGISPYSSKRRYERSFYSEAKIYMEREGYDTSDAPATYFDMFDLMKLLTGKALEDFEDLNPSEYLPSNSNVLNLVNDTRNKKRFRCYYKNK